MNNLKGNAKTDKRKSDRGSVWACPLAYLFDVMAAERSIANNECASHGLTLTARHDAHAQWWVGVGRGAGCRFPKANANATMREQTKGGKEEKKKQRQQKGLGRSEKA